MLLPRPPRASTPTSGVLVEALFALVTLTTSAIVAWKVARTPAAAEPPDATPKDRR